MNVVILVVIMIISQMNLSAHEGTSNTRKTTMKIRRNQPLRILPLILFFVIFLKKDKKKIYIITLNILL